LKSGMMVVKGELKGKLVKGGGVKTSNLKGSSMIEMREIK
jgi:hypothetical protein